MDDVTPESVSVQARWLLDAGTVPTFVNQSFLQVGSPAAAIRPNVVYAAFGHVNPPVVEGPPGTKLTTEQAANLVLPVIPVARLAMSIDTLVELRDKINFVLEEVEKIKPTPGGAS